ELGNPDFAALGRAYGGFGATVERTDQFADAFREAEASGLPGILHVKIDPEAITPTASISDLRAQHAG
ncbi:MAG: thiamine pyrophosphate-binding protein, partial [Pseudomonadota bacterium]|nr:thiamine pyrophosphate-binding protein [Pseudomonadota bacterium]